MAALSRTFAIVRSAVASIFQQSGLTGAFYGMEHIVEIVNTVLAEPSDCYDNTNAVEIKDNEVKSAFTKEGESEFDIPVNILLDMISYMCTGVKR